MSTWSSCCSVSVIFGYLIYKHTSSFSPSYLHTHENTHTQTHTQPVPVRCLRAWHLPQKLPSHCLHGAVINVALDQSAHTASSLDTNQTLMKTSEMPPRPLASTHTVPNHMPLLTPKHTPLIGAIVEKLVATTRGPKMWRCGGFQFEHVASSHLVFQPSLGVSALKQYLFSFH